MGIRYDALLNGLKEVEHDNHIIVDRKSDRIQEVSLKRFLLFSNVLVAANIKLTQIKADPDYKTKKAEAKSRLEGEKKLSQLRKFNSIYSSWQNSINNKDVPQEIKELKKEQKKLVKVIEKMTQFKEALGKDKIDLKLFEEVTDIDKKQFQELNDSINALKMRQEVISSHINVKEGKALTPDQAVRILRLKKKADAVLKDEAINSLKVQLYRDVTLLKELKLELKKEYDVLVNSENPNQIDGIVEKIKKYEALHNSVDEQFSRIAKKGMREKAIKDIRALLLDRSQFNLNQLVDARAKIEVYNNDALKLSPLEKRHNKEAVDLHKSLVFLKKLEKKLLDEEIKIREQERSSAHESIERDEPKISIPLPNLDNVEEAQKEALLHEYARKVEAYDKNRDEIVTPAKDKADKAIDREFDYTYVESKIIDLRDFPYVKAYDLYQKGQPAEAGKQIWKLLIRTKEGKLPSKDDFDHEAKEIFGERLDPQIYNGLINDFHKSKKADAQGDLVWFMWVNDKKSIPTFDEFKAAFEEKVGIEPLKENYDRLIHHLNTQGKPMVAENVWIHLSGKNNEPPSWNDFRTLFKESLGVEPEKELYTALVRKELDEKEDKFKEVLGDLKGLAPYVKPKETWYAKDDKTIRTKLKEIESEIEKINARLIEKADESRGSTDEDAKQLRKQLEQTILERESVFNFLINKDRVQLRNEAQQLNSRIKLLRSRLEEAP